MTTTSDDDTKQEYNIILLGDRKVGKTSLYRYFLGKKFKASDDDDDDDDDSPCAGDNPNFRKGTKTVVMSRYVV